MKFAARAPQGFQTAFQEAYGSQDIASIPIEAGKDKDLKVKVTPPSDTKAGNYPVAVQVQAEDTTADGQMAMQITGQPKLEADGPGWPALDHGRRRRDRRADLAHLDQ